MRNGYLFVDLFFVISGFVICATYATRLETLGDFRSFLIRRFGRLFPLLVFSTVLYVLAKNGLIWAKRGAVALGHGDRFREAGFNDYLIPSAAEIVSTLTFTHGMGVFDRLVLNPVSWSISTEFYAYVLFAVICLWVTGRARLAIFALLSAVGFVATAWATSELHGCVNHGKCFDVTYDFGFARCVGSFFLGALVWHFSRAGRFSAGALQLAGLLGLAALFYFADVFPALAFVTPLLFAVLVLSVCRDTGWLSAVLKTRPCQVLGQRSYSVYMIHPVLMLCMAPFVRHATGAVAGTVAIVAYVGMLVVASGWTYRWIEDPLRRMFNRLADGKKAAAVTRSPQQAE